MRENIWYRFDWALLGAAILLSIIGLISIFSTTQSGWGWELLSKRFLSQAIYLLVGLVVCFGVARWEYREWRGYVYPLFLAAVITLLAVLWFGQMVNGARSWFDFGLISLQPAEFAKPIFILTLAAYLGQKRRHTVYSILPSALFLLPLVLLIMRQPDLGTAMVFLAIWLFVLLGIKLPGRQKLFLVLTGLIIILLAVVVAIILLPDGHFQKARLLVYPDHLLLLPKRHLETGYQVDQALIAIGSGGFWGRGLGQGSQSQLGFIPAAQTDFIFAAIAEEMGFVTIIVLLLLFLFLLWRILIIAVYAQDEFGRLLVFGVFGMIFFHFIQAVGMTVGLLPVTGVPLVLVSYGGSSLLTTYLSLGFIESIKMRDKRAS